MAEISQNRRILRFRLTTQNRQRADLGCGKLGQIASRLHCLTHSHLTYRTNDEHLGISVSCMQPLSLQKHQPGQAHQPRQTLSEIFSDKVADTAAIGYMLARLPRTNAPILWVQDRLSCRETGRPYLAGIGMKTSDYHCQFVPRSRCALGHRRRTALLCVGGGGWRILGRSQCVDVHRNQTFGTKIRGGECTLLADPPCRHTKPKCRTRTLVDWIGSVGFASLRCPSAGGTSLVARSFSLAAGKAGQMDGDI